MKEPQPTVGFDDHYVASQEKRFAKLAPMREALHLFIRQVLAELPERARVLCIGVGTGPELLYLAKAFPGWQFTAVEPAAPMLAACRKRAEAEGIAARCTFHQGTLDTLPEGEPFDAATCLLVSHFILNAEERREFYRGIAARLRPGGTLVNADLAGDVSDPAHQGLLDVWMRTMKYTGMSDAELEKHRNSFETDVAVLPPAELAALINASGFETPVLFFQSLMIHAWFSKRAAPVH